VRRHAVAHFHATDLLGQVDQSILLTTPDVQHELRTAAGTTSFSQQRADAPWKPGLTNVHARQPRVVRQSSPQAPELPLRATLRKSLPGRSVFWRGPSCAETMPAIPETATTNADAIIRLRRRTATSCGNFPGSPFRRFPIAAGYELAHMLAAIDEAAAERDMRLAIHVSFTPSSWVIVRIQLSNSERVCVRVLAAEKRPSFASLPPFETKGAGKAGCTLHPRSRVQFAHEIAHTSIQGSGGIPAFPAR
jgi:hypothetical protein